MNLKDKKIALVGATDDQSKYGFKIFRDLINNGYDVTGINPKKAMILGKTIYKNLAELPKKPDLVITVVPPEITEKIVEECNKLGINHIWMQPGSESKKALLKAEEYSIKTTAACFMVNNRIW